MSKQTEALKLALVAERVLKAWDDPQGMPALCEEMTALREALAEQPAQQRINCKFKRDNNGVCPHHNLQCGWPKCNEPEQPVQQQEQKLEFVSPGGGYVPAIPRPMPLDWKLVPRKATPEMLRAMDECAQEGYDERLYEGMASSVYMAAWDASPVMGTLPEQPAQQQEPVAVYVGETWCGSVVRLYEDLPLETPLYTSPPASKPWVGLTDEDLAGCDDEELKQARYWEAKLREKNA